MNLAELRAALVTDLAGRYALDADELGTGGMALVFGAGDLRHGRRVAVKVMRPDQAQVFGADRFLREIRLTAGLQHPHILPLLDSGSVSPAGVAIPYYIMPMVAGQSLRTKLDVDGQLGLKETLAIARDVTEGLQYAHDHGVIHRDIKPENILLNETGAALIADFGVARAAPADEALALTEVGTTVGTPAYMSPEQLFGTAPADARSDQFSVAATVFEMLAARAPFEASSREALMVRRLAGLPDSLRSYRVDLPPSVERALAKGLELKPADRYSSVRDLFDALAAAAEGSAPAQSASTRRRSWRVGAVAAGALVIVGGVGAWYARRPVRTLTGGAMVVLADVENLTSDSTLGRAVRAAAVVGLRQSSSFSLYPRTRLPTSLARMKRTITDTVLSEALAREIAYRESGKAVVVLSLTESGRGFSVAARVIDPVTGEDLAANRVQTDGPDGLLEAVDKVVGWTRRRLGDTQVNRAAPLPLVTTSSLPALRAYADGLAAFGLDWATVGPSLQRAVELDTGFAMAQMLLGQYHMALNQVPAGLKWLREADRRSGRLTEPEQLNVKSALARAEGRFNDQLSLARSLATSYPSARHWGLYGGALRIAERYREAIEAFEQAVALDSTDADSYHGLANAHKGAGNYRVALDYYTRVDQLDSIQLLRDFANHQWGDAYVSIGDLASAEAVFRRMVAQPNPDNRARGHRSLAYLALYRGRYKDAVAELRQGIRLQPPGGMSEYRDVLVLADAELTRGEIAAARAALDRAFAIFRQTNIQAAAVMFGGHQFVRAGQLGRARVLLDSLRARAALRPNAAQDQAALAILSADLALAQGQLERARAALATGRFAAYSALGLSLQAEWFSSRGQLDSAVATARTATESRNFGHEMQQDWLRSFGQLARLAEAVGDSATARAAYSSLIEQWGDGDADLPPLVTARRELARLQAAARR